MIEIEGGDIVKLTKPDTLEKSVGFVVSERSDFKRATFLVTADFRAHHSRRLFS